MNKLNPQFEKYITSLMPGRYDWHRKELYFFLGYALWKSGVHISYIGSHHLSGNYSDPQSIILRDNSITCNYIECPIAPYSSGIFRSSLIINILSDYFELKTCGSSSKKEDYMQASICLPRSETRTTNRLNLRYDDTLFLKTSALINELVKRHGINNEQTY